MDSDERSDIKPNRFELKEMPIGVGLYIAACGGIALTGKLVNPKFSVLGFLCVASVIFLLVAVDSLNSLIKPKMLAACAVLSIIGLLTVAFVAKGHRPQLSSISLLTASFLSLGVVAVTFFSKLQNFLYSRGYRGNMPSKLDGGSFGGGCSSGDHASWGSDCGGGDFGGGGDCG